MRRASILFTSVLLLSGLAMAQGSPAPEAKREFFFAQTAPLHTLGPDAGFSFMTEQSELGNDVAFISAEIASRGEVVTAAPYTATAVTETTQVLADGNRIVNKNSAFLARDGQGRTRREETLPKLGPLSVDSPKLIFIHDPIAHTSMTLQPSKQSAMVIKGIGPDANAPIQIVTTRRVEGPGKVVVDGSSDHIFTRRVEGPGKVIINTATERGTLDEKATKHEDLGTQTIEGVLAEGKRETVTIPAGQIGNEKPIDIVSERWYSQELHEVVLRKRSDPRLGESIYRLTDIKRGEPDSSLFQVPSGYKITAEPTLLFKHAAPKE